MRIFQLIVASISFILTLSMLAFNFWIASNFSKNVALPDCYIPLNIISTVFIVITILITFIKK